MHRLSLAVIAATCTVVTFAQIASAADLPRKAPAYTPPPAPIFTWSGFYIGGSAGYHWAHAGNSATTISQDPNFGYWDPVTAAALAAAAGNTLKPAGFAGGAYAGYNWQTSSLVLGLEGDFTGLVGTDSRVTFFPIPFSTSTAVLTGSAKDKWMATIRGRVGYALDRLLFYATGGVAWSNWELAHSYTDNIPATRTAFGAITSTTTRTGWVVGGGLEYAFGYNWVIRGEYLYADFGTANSSFLVSNTNDCGGGRTCMFTFNHSEKLTEKIARAGLSYKFGGP